MARNISIVAFSKYKRIDVIRRILCISALYCRGPELAHVCPLENKLIIEC